MEIKLKAARSNIETGLIVDEYGALWKYSGTRIGRDIFLATTNGLNGETIQGFYQNGIVFIVSLSDARRYFSGVNFREVPYGVRCHDA